MTQPTPDARAVVRALDALTTQVRRVADGLWPTDQQRANDAATTAGRPVVGIDPGTNPDMVVTQWMTDPPGAAEHRARVAEWITGGTRDASIPEQAPAADEEQTLRWARRESLLVLLTRLQRGRTLTEAEAGTLRHHVETEIRETDTARTEAKRLGLMVDEYSAGARQLSESLRTEKGRTKTAVTELRVLRAGLRANGADPTQIQNLWAQIRLRNRQWAEAKKEVRLARNLLEEGEVDTDLIDEMVATVESAHARELEALAETEKLRALLATETARANAAIDRETTTEQAVEEQRAAIERVRTAMTWARHHHPGLRHVHERLAAALDGTEQPTTEV